MAKYTIEFLEQQTTNTGKIKANCLLKDEQGQDHDGVTLWADFPDFANLAPGREVEGNLTAKDYNGKTYFTLYPIKANPMGARPAWAGKGSGIAKAQETKREDIKAAQENKHEAIKMAGAMRDATLITLAELSGSPLVAEDFKMRWTDWRKWLMDKANEPFA